MRFRLRTLLIVLALGPALIAMGYWYAKEHAARRKLDEQFRNAYDNRRLNDVRPLRPELSDKAH
jgi:hypothetical protein